MEYTRESFEQKIYGKVYEVYSIFKNFFGVEFVDLQNADIEDDILGLYGETNKETFTDDDVNAVIRLKTNTVNSHPFILVYWPSVTVTNENDKSVVIKDLYAKVTVNIQGCIPWECQGFLLNRATYTKEQFLCNYMHSHISGIPTENYSRFMTPCLGTGPINNTINTLKNTFDEVTWLLFCRELALYVTVESISGVPYHRLESIGGTTENTNYQYGTLFGRNFCYGRLEENLYKGAVNDFIKYYLVTGHFKFAYTNGHFTCGNTFIELAVDMSNCFIKFFNTLEPCYYRRHPDDLEKDNVIINAIIKGNRVFIRQSNSRRFILPESNRHIVCTFKGKYVFLNVVEETDPQNTVTKLLDSTFIDYIINKILVTLDYEYRDKASGNPQEGTSTIGKNAYYL